MLTALMLVLSSVQEPQSPLDALEALHRVNPGVAGGLEIANPAHGMRGHFSEGGVSLSGEGWNASIAFTAWGRAGEMSAVAPVEPTSQGCRVEYLRPGIAEWYVNGPRGLEQGFTLAAAPEGEGPVRMQVAIDGELELEILPGGRDARLLDGDARAVFHYVGLTAWDATGRHLAAALSAVQGGLALDVFDHGAVYPLTIDPWMGTEVAVLTPEAGPLYEDHLFGASLALQQDTLAVGAPGTGGTGSARIFYRDQGGTGAWGMVTELTGTVPGGSFGSAAALDGNTLVVGDHVSSNQLPGGRARVFERDQGGADAWGEVATLTGNQVIDDYFGGALAIEGDTIVAGATGEDLTFVDEGAVYVFGRDQGGPGNWGLVQRLANPTPNGFDSFGASVAVSGNTLVAGASGSVEVYERTAGIWTGVQTITSGSGYFGWDLAIDETSLLVGDPNTQFNSGAANHYERVAGVWTLTQLLKPSLPGPGDQFGSSVALLGDQALIGTPHGNQPGLSWCGNAYLFERKSGTGVWAQSLELTASNAESSDTYGTRVALDGTTAVVGALNKDQGTAFLPVRGAAFDSLTNTLYGVTKTPAQLIRIDTSTGAGTYIGTVGFKEVLGLAFDPGAGILYGAAAQTKQLIRIDPSTGVGQAIGTTGTGRIMGLAFDSSAGVLYGCDDTSDSLVRIDPATGAAVAVGPLAGKIHGLDYDSWTDTLYGSDVLTEQLIAIDKHTGASTVIGSLGFVNVEALAFDPGTSTLYGVDKAESGTLIEIDPTSGAGYAVGQISTLQAVAGAVYVIALEFTAETYCTAGFSAGGCQAAISSAGAASATAPSGFSLLVTGAEGSKDGQFFFAANGRQANPWGNGTSFQCVAPPVHRAGALAGIGTNGACDGAFSQDLNSRWCPTCPKPNHNPGAGAVVQAQLWYRDPLSTSNQTTSLSDAVEFPVAP